MADTAAGSRRPADTAFKQQRLKSWQPILTPKWVIGSFMTVGIVFIAIAIAVLGASSGVLQVSEKYSVKCKESDPNVCEIKIKTSDDDGWEKQDVYAYYQLDNFYQNHRKYVQSRSAEQLSGDLLAGLNDESPQLLTKDSSLKDCTLSAPNSEFKDPSDEDKKVYMYPCGLIAQSLFNDTFFLREEATGKYVMWDMWNDGNSPCGERPCPTNPSGIAWASDLSKKFKAPNVAWIKQNCKYLGGAALNTSGWIDAEIGKMLAAGHLKQAVNCGAPSCGYRVHDVNGAPNSGIYNCWHNVTDEDFVVWMRVAALPSFKKLYRKIPKGALKKDTTYVLEVHDRFPVAGFKGGKHFVLSTTSWIGGKNSFLGYAYVVVGAICVALALAFLAKQLISPRKMGDPRYLNLQ